jgi:hypothetical protein
MSWTSAYDIINLLKKQLGLNEDFFIIERVWKKEINIDGIKLNGYKNGIIFIQTQSSVANSEFVIRKRSIIKKLNQYMINQKIKNIKLKIE